MKYFISCDWGTSSFRLRLVETESRKIIAVLQSHQGIAATYALWQAGATTDRLLFYSDFLQHQINALRAQVKEFPNDIKAVVSGMASSTIGMLELPYKSIPFNVKKAELDATWIGASAALPYDTLIISGVRSANDVMRGEETILAGCVVETIEEEQLLIFPGTHSKHVVVKNGVAESIDTFMTGELFNLLSTKSILSGSVEPGHATGNSEHFITGVNHAVAGNFLNNIFHVRTNQLFGRLVKEENYPYLSGLVIGEELKSITGNNYQSVHIVAGGNLQQQYLQAMRTLYPQQLCRQQDADEALVNGQAIILQQYPTFV